MIKPVAPMLIGEMTEPFNSPDYIFELKLDGIRCIAYLDGETRLLNKRFLDCLLYTSPQLQYVRRHFLRLQIGLLLFD